MEDDIRKGTCVCVCVCVCVYVTRSLYCSVEIDTVLYINYIYLKKRKVERDLSGLRQIRAESPFPRAVCCQGSVLESPGQLYASLVSSNELCVYLL